MRHAALMLLLIPALSGCTAVKATVHLAQIEEPWHDATEARAEERATYEYVLAEQYRLKAREEWGYNDYDDAEAMARKARIYAQQALDLALYGASDDDAQRRDEIMRSIDDTEDFVPEDVKRDDDAPANPDDEDWDF